MKKLSLVVSLIITSIFLSGCLWNLWHGTILAKSNQRLEFNVFSDVPNRTIYVACMHPTHFDTETVSEDPVAFLNAGLTAWIMDRVDLQGNDLYDANHENLGQSITKTGATPLFTDSSGLSIYQAVFQNIRIGADIGNTPDQCWGTTGYAMDNRAPYKAKIIAFYYNSQNAPVFVSMFTKQEGDCANGQVAQGKSIADALAICGNPGRKVLHLYANQLHAPL